MSICFFVLRYPDHRYLGLVGPKTPTLSAVRKRKQIHVFGGSKVIKIARVVHSTWKHFGHPQVWRNWFLDGFFFAGKHLTIWWLEKMMCSFSKFVGDTFFFGGWLTVFFVKKKSPQKCLLSPWQSQRATIFSRRALLPSKVFYGALVDPGSWERYTPPETNTAPKNRPSPKENNLPTINFQVQAVSFRECKTLFFFLNAPFWSHFFFPRAYSENPSRFGTFPGLFKGGWRMGLFLRGIDY